jgi:hypothetical protein
MLYAILLCIVEQYALSRARVFLRWSRIFEKKRKRKGGKEKEKRRKKKRKRITS